MRFRFPIAALFLAAASFAAAPSVHADNAQEKHADQAIAYLLEEVQHSTLTFVRNGKAYDGKAAADHMRQKAAYFQKRIHSPEDFIKYAGSKSELSGKPYEVQFPDGNRIRCDAWLMGLLSNFRKGTPAEKSPAKKAPPGPVIKYKEGA